MVNRLAGASMTLYKYGSSSKSVAAPATTEFDILKASHKFLREDEEGPKLSWNEQLAKKYYDNLYREYAVCDLKHYKTGNFALRWRTESEVISGAGETTCGNTRCPLHTASYAERKSLKTLELPFSYIEDAESKFALVKVVLCDRCLKKLMWKRNKEKEKAGESLEKEGGQGVAVQKVKQEEVEDDAPSPKASPSHKRRGNINDRPHRNEEEEEIDRTRRRRHSRSRSPAHSRRHDRTRDHTRG